MSFIPDYTTLVAFTIAAIILTITPGPDMTLFLSRAINHGRAAGLACMLGASSGILVHTALAAVGLSALLAASATAFSIVKFAGAGYLLWLAYQAIVHGSALNVKKSEAEKAISLRRHFLTGVGINLLNPKIVLFFISFLPQFIALDDPNPAATLVFLGFYFLLIAIPMVIPLILAADRVAEALKRNKSISRTMDYLFASVFVIFAARILLFDR